MSNTCTLKVEREIVEKNGKTYKNLFLIVPKFNGEVKKISLYDLNGYSREFINDYLDSVK